MVWETRVQSQVELYQRLRKWYLIYKVQIKGKIGAIQGMEYCHSLHLDVVVIEKGVFRSSSATVANN